MDILVPIGVLALALLLGFVFISQALSERKINILKLIYASTIIVVYLLIIFVFFDNIKENETISKIMNYIYFASYMLVGLSFLINNKVCISKKYLNEHFYQCVEKEKLFVLIDRNDKIKAASALLEQEMMGSDEHMAGLRFIDVFNSRYNLVEINGQEFNNDDLKKIFLNLKTATMPSTVIRELKVYDLKTNEPKVIRFKDHIIVENGKYRGHVLIGDAKPGDNVLHVEAELKSKEETLDIIKLRFKSILELTEESLFFYSLQDEYYWGNDSFVERLHLSGNNVSKQEYFKFIHKDDIEYYEQTLSNLTPSKPFYDIKYRFMVGSDYSMVREFGRKIFDATKPEIVGYVEIINAGMYEKTGLSDLDKLKSAEQYELDVRKLYAQGRSFEIVEFRIDNIPQINEKYGRQMGNLLMGEYIKAFNQSFVNDNLFYRIGGLDFAFIITDFRKSDRLHKNLEADRCLHETMRCGSITLNTQTYMGLANYESTRTADEMLQGVRRALKTASMRDYRTDYAYYKDIR